MKVDTRLDQEDCQITLERRRRDLRGQRLKGTRE